MVMHCGTHVIDQPKQKPLRYIHVVSGLMESIGVFALTLGFDRDLGVAA
jgi:hypothetical protein